MPILEVGTLITLAVQAGVSLYNQRANNKNLAEIKKMQQDAKIATQEHSLERDYNKFLRSCELQTKIEEESHAERLKNLNQELLNSFEKLAHNANLNSHYPLTISPYVIGHSVIPFSSTELSNSRQEILCILTNSNDKTFNKEVIPYLDNTLCTLIASFWNQGSMHTMCYFSNSWKENAVFCDEDIDNLKSSIVTPTITITPYFEKDNNGYKVSIKVHLWGIGSELSAVIPSGLHFDAIPLKYTTSDINNIVIALSTSMICIAAQNIDVYYWTVYHQAPLLPSLITDKHIKLSDDLRKEYKNNYIGIYNAFVLGNCTDFQIAKQDLMQLKDVAIINQCNFPENNIKFLNDLSSLLDASDITRPIIQDSFVSLYESTTGEKFSSFNSVRVDLLQKRDIDLIRSLIIIAKKTNNLSLYRELANVVKQKIQYWS